ncbi:MAG: helix-turn-helix transcriptional regulator [Magnetococcus sp. YQC-9]
MIDFFIRLKDERKRLKFNQTVFGELGGVSIDAQSDYETGKRFPDARYLTAIAAAGADVCYILTGTRTPTIPATTSPDESALLDAYRAADEAGRAALLITAKAMARKP